MSGKKSRLTARLFFLLFCLFLLCSGFAALSFAFSTRPEAPSPGKQEESLERTGSDHGSTRPGEYGKVLSDEQADFSEDAGGLPAAESEDGPVSIPQEVTLRDMPLRVVTQPWPGREKMPWPRFRESTFSPARSVNLDMVERFTGPLSQERKEYLQKNRFLLVPLEECKVDPATPMLELFSLIGNGKTYESSLVSNALFVGPDPFLHALHSYLSTRLRYLEQTRLSIALLRMLEGLYDNACLMAGAAGPEGAGSFRRLQAQFLLPLAILKSALPGGNGGASGYEQALQERQAKEFGTSLPASKERALELIRTYDIAEKYAAAIEEELQAVFLADADGTSPLLAKLYGVQHHIDYGRFLPKSRYDDLPVLRSYYRAMQWLDNLSWDLDQESQAMDAVNFALLMSMTPSGEKTAESGFERRAPCEYWGEIMEITSFFYGPASEAAYPEWSAYLQEAAGLTTLGPDTASSPELRERVQTNLADLRPSSPFFSVVRRPKQQWDLRVFPRHFSMSHFLREELTRHSDPERADLPDLYSSLWAAAVLGSPFAQELIAPQVDECLLPHNTATPFQHNRPDTAGKAGSVPPPPGLEERLNRAILGMRMGIHRLGMLLGEEPPESWTSSLSSAWPYLLQNLAVSHGRGMPQYMRSPVFQAKQLESILSSLAEREQETLTEEDTIVPAQASPSEEFFSDKAVPHGFVEPNPAFWRAMLGLVENIRALFAAHDLFPADMDENGVLEVFRTQLELCAVIAEKETRGRRVSRQEYEALRDGLDLSPMAREVEEDSPVVAGKDHEAFCLLQAGDSHLLYGATAKPRIMLVLVGEGQLPRVTVGVAYNHQEFVTAPHVWLTGGQWRQWNAAVAAGQRGISPLPLKPFWYDGLETR